MNIKQVEGNYLVSDADTHTLLANYIIVVSLFFLLGIVLSIFQRRRRIRGEWRRCVHGHWAYQEEYCAECGLFLSPVPKIQQQRIAYIANHTLTRQAITNEELRYAFSLWLTDLERISGETYMLDMALTMCRSNWLFRMEEARELH